MRKKWLFFGIFLFGFWARAGAFFISEIVSHPATGEKESIKIASDGDEIDLSGFSFADENAFSKNKTFFEIPAGMLLKAGSELVFDGWGNVLNNGGDTLYFFDAEKNLIAKIEIPAMAAGEICRVEGEKCAEKAAAENDPENGGAAPFRVVEILSNATPESIKIRSISENDEKIGGFFFADEKSNFFEIPAGTLLKAGSELVFSGWPAKLNNGGDTLFVKNAAGEIFQTIEIPAMAAGEICRVEGEKCAEKSENSKKSRHSKIPPLIKTKSVFPSIDADKIKIRFSEVRFRSDDFDAVELFCEKCDQNFEGFRLGDDDAFFEFPEKSFLKSGDFVTIFLDGQKLPPEKTATGVIFHGPKRDLTGTDETLFVADSRGKIATAICIADQNGTFSPGEKNDLFWLVRQNAIAGRHPFSEEMCADSRPLEKGVSLVFFRDTKNPPRDSFWTTTASFGAPNPPPPIKISDKKFAFSARKLPDGVLLKIKNIGKKKASTRGFSVIFDGKKREIPTKILPPRAAIFFEISPAKTIFIRDFLGEKSEKIAVKNFDKNIKIRPNLEISEIFPDPVGVDKNAEFVEFRCAAEKCDLRKWAAFSGDKKIEFSRNFLRKNEFLAVSAPLKNTGGEISVFDFERKTFEKVAFPAAKTGKSFLPRAQKWTDFPTPAAKNFLGKIAGDANKNKIPDDFDFEFGKMAPAFFPKIIDRKIRVSLFQNIKNEIVIFGVAPPKTKILGKFAGEKFLGIADKNGKFKIKISPDAPPRVRKITIAAKLPSGVFVFRRKTFFNRKNPREKWAKKVKIARVLPNPDGADAGAEKIILKNLEKSPKLLKNFSIKIGDAEKKLPEKWVRGGGEIAFSGAEILPLKNAGGEIFLKNPDGKMISKIAWKNAKSGVFYDGFSRQKKSRKSFLTKKTFEKKPKKIAPPPEKHFSGKIVFREKKVLIFATKSGGRAIGILGKDFSRGVVDKIIAENRPVAVKIVGQKIAAIDLLPPKTFVPRAENVFSAVQKMIFVAMILAIGILGILTFLKKNFFFRQNEAAK